MLHWDVIRLTRWALPALLCAFASLSEAQEVQFNRDVRPILSDKCFACHGLDPKHRKAGLRLDTPEGAAEGGAIVAGDVAKSEVWKRITTTDPEEIMPPRDSHKEITATERDVLKRWIEQGAKYQKHWSFEPIAKPQAPSIATASKNAIDAFLRARLEQDKLGATAEADRATLIRRVSFGLTGLPPTPAEVNAFTTDTSDGAYERMVDRYLASPRFGEEMARHWLDVARYGDTHGLHLDNERQMWAYRDYVINAFNKNKPFDQFTIEQLAGDQLPNPTVEQMTATGYSRSNVTTSEGGSIDAELVFRYAVDRTSTTMEAFLGLTGQCAVCHDHKFDPISAKEFYSLYAFFNSAADPGFDGNAILTAPTVKLVNDEHKTAFAKFDTEIAAKQKDLDARKATITYTDPATLEKRPLATEKETVWFDDDFPAGATTLGSPGHPTTYVTSKDNAPVYSGNRSLKRTDAGLAQDVHQGPGVSLTIPAEGRIFSYVYIDPSNPPKAIMLQFHRADWNQRAVWGDHDVINFGIRKTTQRQQMGKIPAAGKWVRLEFPADKVGLDAGDVINGIAFTQFGGTVYWDKTGVVGRDDPAGDPTKSMIAWQKARAGKDTPQAGPEISELLKKGPEKVTPEEQNKLRDFFYQNVCAETKAQFQPLAGELAAVRQKRAEFEAAIPSTFVFTDLPKPRESFVMLRGEYTKPGEKVEPGTLAALPPLKKANPANQATRLDLAKWMVAPENPLTARVTVNRFWQQFFGTGLVKTSADFGSQGEPPSHPELLDFLASDFRDHNWDVKRLVREFITSQAFRQSSVVTPTLLERDPANRLYARGPRFRLDAEQIRDNVLFVSGLMKFQMGGPGAKPYQPPNIWEPVGFVGSNTRLYVQDKGDALYRRSIYTFLKRTAMPPFMANFDAPSREASCTRRDRSNTPLQALQLMNDVQHVEAARGLAQRMLNEGGATPAERIAFAFRTVLSRNPEPDETKIVETQLAAHLDRYSKDAEAAKLAISHGESTPKDGLAPAELAAYSLVANMILNLDETVTRN